MSQNIAQTLRALKEENERLRQQLADALEETKLLHALQDAGVDSWEGYEVALDSLSED